MHPHPVVGNGCTQIRKLIHFSGLFIHVAVVNTNATARGGQHKNTRGRFDCARLLVHSTCRDRTCHSRTGSTGEKRPHITTDSSAQADLPAGEQQQVGSQVGTVECQPAQMSTTRLAHRGPQSTLGEVTFCKKCNSCWRNVYAAARMATGSRL